jgi:hypothetical protein
MSLFTDDVSNINDKATAETSGYSPLQSNTYPVKIKYAYVEKSKGEALGLNIVATTDTGVEYKETFWMTSGKAKGCKRTFIDKQGNEQFLPGYKHANSLAKIATGKSIDGMVPEQKIINKYSYDQKKEVATPVNMLMDLLGKEVILGIRLKTVNKRVKNGSGYVDSPELKSENETDKIFRASDKKSLYEIENSVEEAKDIEVWLAKNEGKTFDRSKKVSAPPVASAAPTATTATPDISFDSDDGMPF